MNPRLSIRAKLRQVILMTTGVVLLLTAFSFVVNEIISFRKNYREVITTLADVVAESATATLAFFNAEEAGRALGALHNQPNITRAALYDKNGAFFAGYPPSLPAGSFPSSAPALASSYSRGSLIVVRPVIQETRLGTLYIEASLAPLYDRLHFYSMVAAAVLLCSLLIAIALASYFQRRITVPILSLAKTARHISEHRDYHVRAEKTTEDEIGALTDSFNDMLGQIETRDAALFQSTERLRLALEGSQAGIWDWDLRTGKITWDEFLHRLYGLQPGHFAGNFEAFLELFHPADRSSVERAVKRAIEKRREFIIEARILWPDQSLHYIASRGKAFYSPEGQPLRMTGITIDVTEAKRAEQSLRESEERFRTMADAAPVLVWTSGPDKRRDYFNRAWLALTGRSIEQELGDGWLDAIHPDDQTATRRVYQTSSDIRIPFVIEYRLRRIDGQFRWILEHGVPRFAPDGSFQGYIGSCLDITERKQMQGELEVRVQQRTAELAETNRELESFTYSVSHDLRSPLRHMNAYSQILEEDFGRELPEEARAYLQRIREGAKNMGNLVDDLLNLARVGRQELARQATDLNGMIRAIVLDLTNDNPRRKIEWKISPLRPAEADPGLLKQVFTNLLANAVKYSRPREIAEIEIGEFDKDGERVIFVRDNGVGFNMKYAAKLFGVFQRLHRPDEFEGTGVGLAIVERIIRKHRGRIWAEAELDKGATFYFTLPLSEDPAPGQKDDTRPN